MSWQKYSKSVEGVDGVILKHDLTTEIALPSDINNIWATIKTNGGDSGAIGTHHTSEGFTPNNGVGDAGYEFEGLDAGVAASMDLGGQISVTVDARFIVDPNTSINEDDPAVLSTSTGDLPISSASIFSNSGTGAFIFTKQTGGNYQNRTAAGETYFDFGNLAGDIANSGTATVRINGVNKTDPPNGSNKLVRLSIGWVQTSGSTWQMYTAIDDMNSLTWESVVAPSTWLDSNSFYFGSRTGTANAYPARPISDLLISTTAPTWTADTVLERLSIDGDSLGEGGGYNNDNSASSQDVIWWREFTTQLNGQGIQPQSFLNASLGGQSMSGILAGVGTVLAFDPTVHVFQGLTNNALNEDFDSLVEADFVDYVEQLFFGAAKNTRTGLQYFMLNIIPPNEQAISNAGIASTYADIWAYTLAFPALWDSMYPAEAGKVVIGGNLAAELNYDHNNFTSAGIYSRDGTHWDPAGNIGQADSLMANYLAIFSASTPTLTTPFSIEATDNLEKKQESRSAIEIAEGFNGFDTTTESYKLIKLPWNSIVVDAYVMVKEASSLASTTVTLGTTEGSDNIMQSADLTAQGKQGTFAGEQIVKVGKPIFANFDYQNTGATAGEFILVIEYLEYRKGTGEYTKLYTKV